MKSPGKFYLVGARFITWTEYLGKLPEIYQVKLAGKNVYLYQVAKKGLPDGVTCDNYLVARNIYQVNNPGKIR